MRRYKRKRKEILEVWKRKRKEILEVWDFSARLRKLKIIFQVYHQEISCLNY